MLRKLILLFGSIILMSSMVLPCEASQFLEHKEDYIIVIDPGHGGDNYGTTSNENFKEKEITLKVANALANELSRYEGVKVYLTRDDDTDLSLTERAEFAEDVNADMLFSLHFNASENHTMFGTEVWIPLEAPHHAMCYQFAYLQLEEMRDLGLYVRGIKTRRNERGIDYYGVIRDSVSREIPAVIIEHCYVDEERDLPYCSTDEMYEELGKRDAIAIASFLGLDASLPQLPEQLLSMKITDTIANTYEDTSSPDVCIIETKETDYDHGKLTIEVSAADYDTPLVYYSYSLDGGQTYSKWYSWPKCDTLTGAYDDNFSLTLDIPAETIPEVILRAYNKFDLYTDSNILTGFSTFHKAENIPDTSTDHVSANETDNAASPTLKDVEVIVPQKTEEGFFNGTMSTDTKHFLLLFAFSVLWILLLLSATWFVITLIKQHKDK